MLWGDVIRFGQMKNGVGADLGKGPQRLVQTGLSI